jgi:hypothetical protein
MMRPLRRRGERGTSTLEVVGVTPLVVIVIMLLAQVALSLYAITTAQTAVRQAARADSQGDSAFSVLNDSVPGWLEPSPSDVQLFGPGHGVRARFDVPDLVPFFDLSFTREAVMP